MIKRHIPERYVFNSAEVLEAVRGVLGDVPMGFRGRVLEIDATLTPAQITALRTAVVAILESTQDITV